MKVLHWTRMVLSADVPADRETLWWALPEAAFDVEQFEAKFCQLARKKDGGVSASGDAAGADAAAGGKDVAGGDRGRKASVAKREKLSVLDPKRSNAIGILISRLPPPSEIKTAIAHLDEQALGREQLEQILAQLPTAEEEEQLRGVEGQEVLWDRPEAFLRMLLSVPRVGSRLRCWSVHLSFEEKSSELEAPLACLAAACKELMESAGLRMLLSLLLAYGNHMNGGNASKGQADGFALVDGVRALANVLAASLDPSVPKTKSEVVPAWWVE